VQCCVDDGSAEVVMTATDELAWRTLGLSEAMAKQVEGAVVALQVTVDYVFNDIDTDACAQARDEKENGPRWVWRNGEMTRARRDDEDPDASDTSKPLGAYDLLAKFILVRRAICYICYMRAISCLYVCMYVCMYV
jgi:hypothetical protein